MEAIQSISSATRHEDAFRKQGEKVGAQVKDVYAPTPVSSAYQRVALNHRMNRSSPRIQ